MFRSISSHIMMFLLALARGLPFYVEAQREHRWDPAARPGPALDLPSQSLLRWYADDVITRGPFVPERGRVAVPSGPGLGVELDEAAVARGVARFAREGEYDLYAGHAALS